MTDLVLHDIDPLLVERIRFIGEARGWDVAETLMQVLRRGLHAFQNGAEVQFGAFEAGALQEAIAALEQVPNDPGFAMIGRAEPQARAAEQPDQSIPASFAVG